MRALFNISKKRINNSPKMGFGIMHFSLKKRILQLMRNHAHKINALDIDFRKLMQNRKYLYDYAA